MSSLPALIAFTDGAAKGNPGPGGWGAIVVSPDGEVTELGGGSPHATNNQMELTGAIAALECAAAFDGPLAIYTDSTYVIHGITQWVWGWRKRGWKTAQGTDVVNRDLWERLSHLAASRGPANIEWRWVRGHVGTPGNERVDQIAVAFAEGKNANLYRGPLAAYGLPILDVPQATAPPKRPAASATGGPRPVRITPHSYVSVVDGVPARHATWAECEARVKGRSGARFKKTQSADDEAAVLRGWGIQDGLLPWEPRD